MFNRVKVRHIHVIGCSCDGGGVFPVQRANEWGGKSPVQNENASAAGISTIMYSMYAGLTLCLHSISEVDLRLLSK